MQGRVDKKGLPRRIMRRPVVATRPATLLLILATWLGAAEGWCGAGGLAVPWLPTPKSRLGYSRISRRNAACRAARMEMRNAAEASEKDEPLSLTSEGLARMRELEYLLESSVLEEDYAKASMVRDEVKRLRESDRVTGLRSEIEEAMGKQDRGEAERLSKNLYDEVVERSCRPRALNRLLALSQEGSIVTIDPDGSNLGLVAFGNSDLVRHSQPTWSPSGDFVVASEYSGTVLNSPIDSTNHVVVLQARDGKEICREVVPFSPFLYQWSACGCRVAYITNTARALSSLVSLDVVSPSVPRDLEGGAMGAMMGGGTRNVVRRSSETMHTRQLVQSELIFFSQRSEMVRGQEAKGQMAVHCSDEGSVRLIGSDPKVPFEGSPISNKSGVFGAPQWHPKDPRLLFIVEEVKDAGRVQTSNLESDVEGGGEGEGEGEGEEGKGAPARLYTPPDIANMERALDPANANSSTWSGRWWSESTKPKMRASVEVKEQRSRSPGEGRMAGGVARDSLGVVGQYSKAWQRVKSAGKQVLVLAHVDGGGEGGGEQGKASCDSRILKRLDGVGSSFGVSNDGNLMALLEKGGAKGKDSLTVFNGPFTTIDSGELDGGIAVDLGGEEWDESMSCVAFFWSPDSSKLLFLTSPSADAKLYQKMRGMALRCRWNVLDMDTGRVKRFNSFSPSETFLEDYLPKFDQYSRASTIWSPDSKSFCYPGAVRVIEDGYTVERSGAWVQRIEGGGEEGGEGDEGMNLVLEGAQIVTWSPA